MGTFKKKNFKLKETIENIKELVGSDGSIIGGDRNATGNSEIETGPVVKPFNDDSDYEKGTSTTTDRAARYKQNIPWFAVYSYPSSNNQARLSETKKKIVMTKNKMEEKIEDLVKKKSDNEITDKNYNNKLDKITDLLDNIDLTDKQINDLKNLLIKKAKTKPKLKNI